MSVSRMSGYCAVKLPSRGIIQSDSSAGTQVTDSVPELAGRVMRCGGGGDAVEGAGYGRQQLGAVRRELQPLAGALEQLDARATASSALIWWLIAPWVTFSSPAALVSEPWRAVASKARSGLSGGRRLAMAAAPMSLSDSRICEIFSQQIP